MNTEQKIINFINSYIYFLQTQNFSKTCLCCESRKEVCKKQIAILKAYNKTLKGGKTNGNTNNK